MPRSVVTLLLLTMAYPVSAHGQRRASASTPRLMIWQTVSAGAEHSCALDNTGRAYCWGETDGRRLGTTDASGARRPAVVETPQRFRAISAGDSESCALTEAGATVCWGGAAPGLPPHSVGGDMKFRSLMIRGNACGVDSSGAGFCWGENDAGQLGIGDSGTTASAPQMVGGAPRWLDIQPGENHACGLTFQNGARCWGYGVDGQLGNNRGRSNFNPVAVSGDMRFAHIAVGTGHACATTAAGRTYCWGVGGTGALGTGRFANARQPEAVAGGHAFTALAAGRGFTCGLTSRGQAFCWGANALGQLGNGGTDSSATPVPVRGNLAFRSISAGRDHACAVTNDSVIYCWGSNESGQVGAARATRRVTSPTRVAEPATR